MRTLVKWFHGSKRFNFTGSWSALYLIGDAARVGYFVPLNGPLNGHPPSVYYVSLAYKNEQSYYSNTNYYQLYYSMYCLFTCIVTENHNLNNCNKLPRKKSFNGICQRQPDLDAKFP